MIPTANVGRGDDTDREIVEIDPAQQVACRERGDPEAEGEALERFGDFLRALDHQPDAGAERRESEEQFCHGSGALLIIEVAAVSGYLPS